jgi:hypothetical protein
MKKPSKTAAELEASIKVEMWHDLLSVPAATRPPTKRKASNTSADRARMVSAHATKS